MESISSSDNELAVTALSRGSTAQQVVQVSQVVRAERSSGSITIAVVHDQSLKPLRKECKDRKKLKSTPIMLFTTPEDLQDAIDKIDFSPARKVMKILAAADIPGISFHVPSHFEELWVLRCAAKHDKGILLVDGSSTYRDVRLDSWQAHHHAKHKLVIGHRRGVRIRVDGVTSHKRWARSRSNFSTAERDELCERFGDLAGKSGWDEVKGTVSAIMGLLAGGCKFTLTAQGTAGGIYVKYSFGFHALELGAAGAKGTLVATAAGHAIVLGVATAAAIYFIPWESLFDWLKNAVSWLWDRICKIWESFKGWVMSFFTSGSVEKAMLHGARPMDFSK